MKNWVKLLLAGMFFLCLSGSANAITIANFGKILSGNTIDAWLLTLRFDSDLSITLTDDGSSFDFYGSSGRIGTLSGSQPQSFSGLSQGTYYAYNTTSGGSTSSPPPVTDLEDIEDPVFRTEGLELTITPVPEPATMFVFGTGLFFLAGLLRKFRS
ncbi:MAG: PEP-CTERM sorting domain-containing protein [Proteobacteria bacterium]|nr:PEP-CTERM sorting domain-containing protein [Pseudomonadota bacterium]